MTSEIIDNALFFLRRNFIYMLKKFEWRIFLRQSRSFKKLQIIIDIGLMMATMMKLHCLCVNPRFERIIRIWKLCECMRKHKNKIKINTIPL